MSRAIGDSSLRPFVIPDPDVAVIPRVPEDELLILASDGLWDALSNQDACSLALKSYFNTSKLCLIFFSKKENINRCLQRAKERGIAQERAIELTATVLTRTAIDRGSSDNITVVVIDLRQQPPSHNIQVSIINIIKISVIVVKIDQIISENDAVSTPVNSPVSQIITRTTNDRNTSDKTNGDDSVASCTTTTNNQS